MKCPAIVQSGNRIARYCISEVWLVNMVVHKDCIPRQNCVYYLFSTLAQSLLDIGENSKSLLFLILAITVTRPTLGTVKHCSPCCSSCDPRGFCNYWGHYRSYPPEASLLLSLTLVMTAWPDILTSLLVQFLYGLSWHTGHCQARLPSSGCNLYHGEELVGHTSHPGSEITKNILMIHLKFNPESFNPKGIFMERDWVHG